MSTNQHSRISSQSSRSTSVSVEKRIHALEETLREILQNSSQLSKLNQLHLSLPQVNHTEKSLKHIQKYLDSCNKQLFEIHQINQKNSISNETTSTMRVLKASTKNMNDIKQSVKQLLDTLSDSKRTSFDQQSKQLSKEKTHFNPNLKYYLEKSKKQITSMLKRFQQECLLLEVNDTNREIQGKIKERIGEKRGQWDREIKKMSVELGSIKCETQFLKDKRKKERVNEKFNQFMVGQPVVKDKQLVLSIAQEEVELQQLDSIISRNTLKITRQLDTVENQLNSLLQHFKHPVESDEREHISRELLYLNDRWFKLKNLLKGYRKKYMISMREIEQRFILINNMNKGLFVKKLQQLSHLIHEFHKTTEQSTRQFGRREEHINSIYNAMMKTQKLKEMVGINQSIF